jgi:hypothetical protein
LKVTLIALGSRRGEGGVKIEELPPEGATETSRWPVFLTMATP